MNEDTQKRVVAIIGGGAAGAEAAGMFAERGIVAIVFEQNPRPYGKIEDGLPRWHVNLRNKEYEIINSRLSRDGVHFVPLTRIGRDIEFRELARDWGLSAVILANGAWRDRPLPVDGADEYVDRGLIYQNPFIYWFNHFLEEDYRGPRYDVEDGGIVVGGGLGSIDVIKVLQIETVRKALQKLGIDEDMLSIEHQGVPAVLETHGLGWDALGLRGATLFYRRRIEDMPLADIPEDADEKRRKKAEEVRRRILEKAMRKYCFQVRPQRVPVGLVVEEDRLAGLRFQETRIEAGRAVPVEGAVEDVRAPLVISSIGSVPEPMPGIQQDGMLYRYSDPELGRVEGYEAVFGIGNVVTGKGNILASRKHSIEISTQLIERFLGLGEDGHSGEEELLQERNAALETVAAKVADFVDHRPGLDPERVEALVQRVRVRQKEVGYDGDYGRWIERVTPKEQ